MLRCDLQVQVELHQSRDYYGLCCELQDDAAITPVISESSANFIEGLVKDAEEKGAKLQQKYKREQNLIWPVLIDHVTAVSALILPFAGNVACVRA